MIYKIAAAGWTLLLTVATLLPKEVVSRNGIFSIPYADKLIHFTSYALLTFLWSMALNGNTKAKRDVTFVLYGSIFWGILLEVLQWQLNVGRHFEILDIIANIIGSIVGLSVFRKIIKL